MKRKYSVDLRTKKSFIANITSVWCPSLLFNTSPLLNVLVWFFVMFIELLKSLQTKNINPGIRYIMLIQMHSVESNMEYHKLGKKILIFGA